MLLVLAAYHGWSVRFFDVSRAFMHTPIETRAFAVPPEEYQCPILCGVWEMTETVYGLEEALADFDEHFGNVSEDLCDEFGSLCLTRLTSEPAATHSKLTSVMMSKHMDDGVLVCHGEALDRTLTAIGAILMLKTSCPQLRSETKFFGRLLLKTERRFLVKPHAKLLDSLLSCAGLEKCNPVKKQTLKGWSLSPETGRSTEIASLWGCAFRLQPNRQQVKPRP